jgi:hypothetical protein
MLLLWQGTLQPKEDFRSLQPNQIKVFIALFQMLSLCKHVAGSNKRYESMVSLWRRLDMCRLIYKTILVCCSRSFYLVVN